MAMATAKVDNLRVGLKKLMLRWKQVGLGCGPDCSSDGPSSHSGAPNGFLGVYVGTKRKRFVIPARFVNLPVFMDLLDISEEEFGYQSTGGLLLHCDVALFEEIVNCLKNDEHKYANLSLPDFINIFSVSITKPIGFPS